ncbi:hypothetical protein OSTOST_12751, partial [Ostertagia ostertagi]
MTADDESAVNPIDCYQLLTSITTFFIQREAAASSSGTTSNAFTMRLLLVIAATWLPALGEKKTSKSDLSNGFRTEIDWVEWDKAIGVAKDLNKPIFLLIHKTWCGACK